MEMYKDNFKLILYQFLSIISDIYLIVRLTYQARMKSWL